MDFNDRLKSLQRFQSTLNKVSGTKAETLSVRIQELSKYLDREREWVESKQDAVDKRRLKQINKNIKKAVKQFNANLSQLLTDSNKPLTHDAWRAANKEFPELAGISALIESHHGLGVKITANQVIQFDAPQWVEYDERLESGLIKRKVKLRPGNVDPNAKGILKPFHQPGVHLLDKALTPKPASTIAGMADATVEAAITSEEVLDKFRINQSGKILTSPELASVGAPQNAAAIEAIRQNPELAKNPEAFKKLLDNTELTQEGLNKLVSDLDLPSNIIEEVPLTSRLQSVFDFSKSVVKLAPGIGKAGLVLTSVNALSDAAAATTGTYGTVTKTGKEQIASGLNAASGVLGLASLVVPPLAGASAALGGVGMLAENRIERDKRRERDTDIKAGRIQPKRPDPYQTTITKREPSTLEKIASDPLNEFEYLGKQAFSFFGSAVRLASPLGL